MLVIHDEYPHAGPGIRPDCQQGGQLAPVTRLGAVLGHRHGHRSRPGKRLPPSYARDRKSTRLNSSHVRISYAVFCLKKKKKHSSPTSVDKCEDFELQARASQSVRML